MASPSASLQNDVLGLTSPDLLLASDSAHLGEFSEATISGLLTSYEGIFQNSLKSLGETYLGNTTIAGNFSIDGTMSITGDSLSSLGTLYLQNGPLAGNIDFFNNLITIDNKGNIIAQKVTTKQLEIDNTDILSASLGSGKIPAGKTTVVIFTTVVDTKSKVFLTPKASTSGQTPYVKAISGEVSFTVSLDKPLTYDLPFDWWIVDSTNKTN